MKKFEVREVVVETKDGKRAYEAYREMTNQDADLLKSFDTLEAAVEFFKELRPFVHKSSNRLYTHTCFFIEEFEYNEYTEEFEPVGISFDIFPGYGFDKE